MGEEWSCIAYLRRDVERVTWCVGGEERGVMNVKDIGGNVPKRSDRSSLQVILVL